MPSARIREDYLRILRFFRFHARYGKGAPDKAGSCRLHAPQRGLKKLSAERIRQELFKLLVAPRAVPTAANHAKSTAFCALFPRFCAIFRRSSAWRRSMRKTVSLPIRFCVCRC